MTDAMVSVQHLGVEIDGKRLLDGVDLEISAGQCLGIVGETGCGKSLTCRALTGTLPRIKGEVVTGKIEIAGHDVTSASESQWRQLRGRSVAFVPQSSISGLDPVMRISSQLTETIRQIDGRRGGAARQHAARLLEDVGMPEPDRVLESYAHQLSGGMRQRVMIALAMVGEPRVMVADEPTTALDVTIQARILELLRSLCSERQMALILVTHDFDVVQSTSDRVAVMYAGRTVEIGRTTEVLAHPAHPYTVGLLAARPSRAIRGERLRGIPGLPPTPGISGHCRFAARCPHAHSRCYEADPPLMPSGGSSDHAGACVLKEVPNA